MRRILFVLSTLQPSPKAVAAMALGCCWTTFGDELVISSFGGNGQLVFGEISGAAGYSVQWAPSPEGPWSASWDSLATMPHTGAGSATSTVPMFYRVVAHPWPEEMILIPTGDFVMGDTFGDGRSDELPVHTNTLSAFYIDIYEVTKMKWDQVYIWAIDNGYSFGNSGGGRAPDHPVQSVNWYDCVKWLNARSEKEGFTPCYTFNGNPYRTGARTPVCDWGATGFRLPTDAEWEQAARGGYEGRRFPWGDTITHIQANYRSRASDSYDTSSTRGYHPDYDDGGGPPYTSPVGSFAPNGYGLYDMAGNVWEWCWDWFYDGYYELSPDTDPRGPPTGSWRIKRGGNCSDYAYSARISNHGYNSPDIKGVNAGLRCVRSAP